MSFELIESPSIEKIEILANNFSQYIQTQIPDLPPESEDKKFLINAFDVNSELIGGIYANCYWNGLEIDTLWVSEAERGNGLGSKLVKNAESYGINNGAVISFLKTVDAKLFYEKLGYEVYGVLENRPIGTLLFHMKKQLRINV